MDTIVGQGIIKQRFGDLLTENLRVLVLKNNGYESQIMEFIPSVHTPRNLLIRAYLAQPDPMAGTKLDLIQKVFQVKPYLLKILSKY